jgi:hypothetical protein
VFIVTVTVSASNSAVQIKKYPLLVVEGLNPPAHSTVDTSVFPANSGTATGDGVYTNGTTASVVATPNAGFQFLHWTENDVVVSRSDRYTFTNIINQSLVANFVAVPTLSFGKLPNALRISWPTNYAGFNLQQNDAIGTTNWINTTNSKATVGTNYEVDVPTVGGARFFRLWQP